MDIPTCGKCPNIPLVFAYVLFLLFVPSDLEPLPTERHPSQKEPEQRLKEPGANDGGSTAPRSIEASLSEDVFTETELSPIREEEQASNEDLRLDKSSGASAESVQTLTQVEASSPVSQASGKASQPKESAVAEAEDNPPGTATESDSQSPMRSKQHSEEKPPTTTSTSQAQGPSSNTSRPGSQSSATPCAADTISISASPQREANEGTAIPKTNTMQQGKEEKETVEQMPKDGTQNSTEGKHLYLVTNRKPLASNS